MPTIKQVPWRVDIVLTIGEDWSVSVDWAVDCTGYTWEANLVEANGDINSITVTAVDASLGQYTLTMADTITDAIAVTTASSVHNWYLKRTNADNERIWVAGKAYAIKYVE